MPVSGNCSWIRRRELVTGSDHAYRSEIWQMYRRILGGEIIDGKSDSGFIVRFRFAGMISPVYAKVRDNPDNSALAKFFSDKLVAARAHREAFVHLCIGEPPRLSGTESPTLVVLEAFDRWGAWVGGDVSQSIRQNTLKAVAQIRERFPPYALPQVALAPLYKRGLLATV